MRVVSGTLRGRTILAPAGSATRPTTDRTREAIFNALASMDAVSGAVVADLFAGSGAMGIEALSRGAESCTFIESNGAALDMIRRNVRDLALEGRCEIVAGRVETSTMALRGVDLVLADPPYEYDRWRDLLHILESVVNEGGTIVAESGSTIEPIAAESGVWDVVRERKYGRTWVAFLQRT